MLILLRDRDAIVLLLHVFLVARLLVRIRADDPAAVCQLGIKFGCSVAEAFQLLHVAAGLGLDIIGVRWVTCSKLGTVRQTSYTNSLFDTLAGVTVLLCSFHVGSGCQTPDAFRVALEMSHQVFEYGVRNELMNNDWLLINYFSTGISWLSLHRAGYRRWFSRHWPGNWFVPESGLYHQQKCW